MPAGTANCHGEVHALHAAVRAWLPSLPPLDACERHSYPEGELVAENVTLLAARLSEVAPLLDGGASWLTVRTGTGVAVARVTVTALVSAPAELVQATVMVFEPTARLTVAGLVAAAPLTVQVFADPVVVQVTEVDVVEFGNAVPLAGAVMVTTGATTTALRVTETDLVSEPAELVQTTVMVFAPSARLTVAGLVAAAPLTVQVLVEPVVVHVTEVDVAVVLLPSAGAVIVTTEQRSPGCG